MLKEIERSGHITSDLHYEDAAAGIAQSTTGNRPANGDPIPFDRTLAELNAPYAMSGQDGGQPSSENLTSSAAVTFSDPAIEEPHTEVYVPDRGAAHTPPANLKRTRGGSNLSDQAIHDLRAEEVPPDRGDGQCTTAPPVPSAVANLSEPASLDVNTISVPSARGGGHTVSATHNGPAPAKKSRKAKQDVSLIEDQPSGGDGQSTTEVLSDHAVATIVDLWRQRQDLCRAASRLNLQALATCRRYHDGDKDAAQKTWSAIQAGKGDATLSIIVEPYRQSVAGLEASAHALEKQLAKLVKTHPVYPWAKAVKGLGELSLAGLIGEACGNPGDYRTASALWKRFGLAVIEGERQRRVAGAEAALIHGYAPQRRAFAYVVSCNLMKSQGSEGPYRQVYDERKAYELGREIPKAHAHNRALRYMVKRLLRDLWAADRRLRAQ